MSTRTTPPQSLRTLIAAGLIALMVQLVHSPDALRDFTRPIVASTLRVIGFTVEDRGEMLAVGSLEVPWTRDCSGVNLLLILVALAIWVNRQEKLSLRWALRIGLMVPAALAANVARVLTLISWRAVFYPAVESPQTHYFMGLVWLVPFVSWITPKSGRPRFHGFMETLHAAAVVALLAPMSGAPNGTLITIAAVLGMTQCTLRQDHLRLRSLLMVPWLVGGIGIALMNMDSFWLPWLLVCPLLVATDWVKSLAGLIIIACTHSVFVMQPWVLPVGVIGVAYSLLTGFKVRPSREEANLAESGWWGLRAIRRTCVLFFALPFLGSTLIPSGHDAWTPPSTVESRPMGSDGVELKLPGQSGDLGLLCYSSPGRDRHHTLKVCLKYRGTEVTTVADGSAVMTDGKHWLREFFLQEGHLINDYGSYLRSTFRPWASPGQHLIFISPKDKFTPADFEEQCRAVATQLHDLCTSTSQALATNP
jgi:exosortase/archaeosortase family protein